ncbi:MAG: S41 family peptidase [Actinobacteria bacterium]|nr:S41 family peptidase [Actinomycetota bacterium]
MAAEFENPRRRRLTGLLPVAVGVVLAILAGAGLYVLLTDTGTTSARAAADTAADLEPVIELYEALTSDAVDPPDTDELVEGAIEGMLDQVDDDYATYFAEEDFTEFNDSLDGTFSGVGLMLEQPPNEPPVIISVLEGTPAARAGIEEGEQIVEVDGEDVASDPLESIVAKVKGEAGTTVTLSLAGGDKGRRTLEITRAEFDLPLVDSELIDGDIGYVRLLQFANNSGQRVRREVDELLADGARGIVLDLRANPGGLLDEAVSVASVFIEDGEIVAVEERGGQRESLSAVDDAFEDVPLAMLIDENSASASEIVAGAIQDAGRGALVGETTFGKGSVQTIARFSDGSGAKFTTARYFTPSGDSIEGVGVEPEVEVVISDDDRPTGLDDDPQVSAAISEVNARIAADG